MSGTWKKDERTGQWIVCAPVAELRRGTVTVRTKAGKESSVAVGKISKSWVRDGIEMAFGYPEPEDDEGWECDNCGYNQGIYPRRDSNGISGKVCRDCRYESSETLSFA